MKQFKNLKDMFLTGRYTIEQRSKTYLVKDASGAIVHITDDYNKAQRAINPLKYSLANGKHYSKGNKVW